MQLSGQAVTLHTQNYDPGLEQCSVDGWSRRTGDQPSGKELRGVQQHFTFYSPPSEGAKVRVLPASQKEPCQIQAKADIFEAISLKTEFITAVSVLPKPFF